MDAVVDQRQLLLFGPILLGRRRNRSRVPRNQRTRQRCVSGFLRLLRLLRYGLILRGRHRRSIIPTVGFSFRIGRYCCFGRLDRFRIRRNLAGGDQRFATLLHLEFLLFTFAFAAHTKNHADRNTGKKDRRSPQTDQWQRLSRHRHQPDRDGHVHKGLHRDNQTESEHHQPLRRPVAPSHDHTGPVENPQIEHKHDDSPHHAILFDNKGIGKIGIGVRELRPLSTVPGALADNTARGDGDFGLLGLEAVLTGLFVVGHDFGRSGKLRQSVHPRLGTPHPGNVHDGNQHQTARTGNEVQPVQLTLSHTSDHQHNHAREPQDRRGRKVGGQNHKCRDDDRHNQRLGGLIPDVETALWIPRPSAGGERRQHGNLGDHPLPDTELLGQHHHEGHLQQFGGLERQPRTGDLDPPRGFVERNPDHIGEQHQHDTELEQRLGIPRVIFIVDPVYNDDDKEADHDESGLSEEVVRRISVHFAVSHGSRGGVNHQQRHEKKGGYDNPQRFIASKEQKFPFFRHNAKLLNFHESVTVGRTHFISKGNCRQAANRRTRSIATSSIPTRTDQPAFSVPPHLPDSVHISSIPRTQPAQRPSIVPRTTARCHCLT